MTNRSGAAKRRARKEREANNPCPTPRKKQFATREGAEAFVAGGAIRGRGLVNAVYRCGCGWWHSSSRGATRVGGIDRTETTQ